MFTGIIKETGKVKKSLKVNSGLEFEVESAVLTKDMIIGDSIAVNGVCLTVKSYSQNSFKADVSFATLKASTLGALKTGSVVNLEDAVRMNGKFGGHIVAGHVDNKAEISKIEKNGDYFLFDICAPDEILPYAAPKGSITVDGISLTISQVFKNIIRIAVIPFTFQKTNLKYKKQGDFVNLEIDLMARYVANIAKYGAFSKSPLKTKPQADLNYSKLFSNANEFKGLKNNISAPGEEYKLGEEERILKNKILEEKLKKYGFKK